MVKIMSSIVWGFLIIIGSQMTWAHSEEQLKSIEAPHGGQLRPAGPFHLELIAKDNELTLYITDHGNKPIQSAGGEGKANILITDEKGGNKQSVKLEPVYGNMMKAKGDFKLTPQTVIAVLLAVPGYETQGARFTPLSTEESTSSHDHQHDHSDSHADDHDHNHDKKHDCEHCKTQHN
ncbi:MAG: hypothetical protein IPI97_12405 [Nitrosomonas sp.]|nr:hypothetical protein [Nitrosomonas sp.]MBK7365754.1 hypothetical protein [Nitrosomonas sp.]